MYEQLRIIMSLKEINLKRSRNEIEGCPIKAEKADVDLAKNFAKSKNSHFGMRAVVCLVSNHIKHVTRCRDTTIVQVDLNIQ